MPPGPGERSPKRCPACARENDPSAPTCKRCGAFLQRRYQGLPWLLLVAGGSMALLYGSYATGAVTLACTRGTAGVVCRVQHRTWLGSVTTDGPVLRGVYDARLSSAARTVRRRQPDGSYEERVVRDTALVLADEQGTSLAEFPSGPEPGQTAASMLSAFLQAGTPGPILIELPTRGIVWVVLGALVLLSALAGWYATRPNPPRWLEP